MVEGLFEHVAVDGPPCLVLVEDLAHDHALAEELGANHEFTKQLLDELIELLFDYSRLVGDQLY